MSKGFVTIPTDKDFVEGTKKYIELWGADAIRDCDGVSLPDNLKQFGTEVYKAYLTVRMDQKFPREHPEYLQNMAIVTDRKVAQSDVLEIDIMENLYKDQLVPNDANYKKYWQVFDRTTGEEHKDFEYLGNNIVRIYKTKKYHEYTVNFFGKNIWDMTHIYNYNVNKWTGQKHIDLDPAYPEALNHMLSYFENWLQENKEITVVRFTTFFYHFFILNSGPLQSKIWDWHAYASTASPKMFELFKEEKGYEITLEDVLVEGTFGNRFFIPSKRTRDYIDFVQMKCCFWAKMFVDLCHKYNRKAMMFDGDNRIGVEPYNKYFPSIGLDAVVGAPNSGVGIQTIANMDGVKYTEGRFAPYFFPNECPNDKDGTNLLTYYWNTERRSLLRKSIDRIGFGGFLKQIDTYPNFVNKITEICNEFRLIKENSGKEGCYKKASVAILSYWGKMDSWMLSSRCVDDMRQDGIPYSGLLPALCGQPFDVSFISFDDVINNDISNFDVLITGGIPQTSFQGGEIWKNAALVTKIREYVANGGGLIGIGEPSGYYFQGKYFQLSDIFGVEKEDNYHHGFNRPIMEINSNSWIAEDIDLSQIKFSNIIRGVYPTTAQVIACHYDDLYPEGCHNAGHVDFAINSYGKGRAVYFSSILDNPRMFRLLYKSILWSSNKEDMLFRIYVDNINCDAFYYQSSKTYAVINNSDVEENTKFFDKDSKEKELKLKPKEIIWIK